MAKKTTLRIGLIGYIDSLAENLRASLVLALKGDEDAIHDARVATRRLKAVIDLFAGQLSERMKSKFGKSLKRIRRSLGTLRDIDVMIEHAGKMAASDAMAAAHLKEHLRGKRRKELAKIAELDAAKLLSRLGSWWGLRSQIKQEAAQPLLQASLRLQLEQFCALADLHSADKNALPPLVAEPADDTEPGTSIELNPHDMRIAGKALRYTLEMALEDSTKIPAGVIQTFKRMQEMLGLWHDHVVLVSTIMKVSVDTELGYRNPDLLKRNLKLAQAAARRAELRLLDFVKLWRKQGAELQRQITAAIDQASEPAAAPDAALSEPAVIATPVVAAT